MKKENIITICYGQAKHWTSRAEALQYFAEGAMVCEGSEAERYAKIYFQLREGKKIVVED